MFEFGALFRSPTADRDYSTLFLKYLYCRLHEEKAIAMCCNDVSDKYKVQESCLRISVSSDNSKNK